MKIGYTPFFMTNEEWYYFDEDEFTIKLTDKAPKKAVESYEKYKKETKKIYIDE